MTRLLGNRSTEYKRLKSHTSDSHSDHPWLNQLEKITVQIALRVYQIGTKY
jgi:hypothetical protein